MKKGIVFLFLWPLGICHSGDIVGRLHFQNAKTNPPVVSRYGTGMEKMKMTPASKDVRAVVYIADSFPDSSFHPPEQHPVMDQRNEQFVPYLLPVVVGTTVDFPNNDKVYHNVFSFSKTKSFDLGKYPTKTFKQVTFDKIGVVSLYCEIHAHMNAFILVLPNPYFDQVGTTGEFHIKDVPEGEFTLKVFFGRDQEQEKPVTVPATGAVKVEFYQ